jgi:gluconolactonase
MPWNFELAAGPYGCALVGVAPLGADVIFSAVTDNKLFRIDAAGEVTPWRGYTSRTSGLAEGPHGLLYGCQEASRRVCEFNPDGSSAVTATTLNGKYHNHPSDATVDKAGRVWFCDPHNAVPAFGPQMFPVLPFAAVLRAARGPNHRWGMERLTHDTAHPRALALSPDEKTLYVAEGRTAPDAARELRAYPVSADGSLGQPNVLMTFGADHRGPHRGIEGLCVDSQGYLIACGGYKRSGPGPMLYVFSPGGAVVEAHELPDDMPMRCAFGGPGRGTLYVTTATGRLWKASDTGRTGLARFADN